MKIQEIMTAEPTVCRADDTLNTAAQLMWENDCGCIPVLAEDGKLAAIITDRDICMAAYTQGKSLNEIRVEESMTRRPFCCNADDNVENIARMMSARQVRRVPVVGDDQVLVGVVSLADIARTLDVKLPNSQAAQQFVATVAAISKKRPARKSKAKPNVDEASVPEQLFVSR